MIELKPLSLQDAEQIRLWRNQCLETLRTPYPLTVEQQADWYIETVCNRSANARWFGVWKPKSNFVRCPGSEDMPEPKQSPPTLIGYAGIENISWENRIGEISLLIDPQYHGKGYGKQAANAVLDYAFDNLNLHTVYGECYLSNPAVDFWKKITAEREGYTTTLPCRKYHGGQYYGSLYFSIEREEK